VTLWEREGWGVQILKCEHSFSPTEEERQFCPRGLDLREIEKPKIECARKFFAKITSYQVRYDVMDSDGKLMELVSLFPPQDRKRGNDSHNFCVRGHKKRLQRAKNGKLGPRPQGIALPTKWQVCGKRQKPLVPKKYRNHLRSLYLLGFRGEPAVGLSLPKEGLWIKASQNRNAADRGMPVELTFSSTPLHQQ